MHGDASGLIDDDHVVIFVHDAYWLGCNGWLVAVECVGDDLAVAD